jgi:putative phosphoribosyl transferase
VGVFADRQHAGQQLAERLPDLRSKGVVVLAVPRGGVPVASEIARSLRAELDVLVVQKIGAPGQPELAVGAVTSDGTVAVNGRIARALNIDVPKLEAQAVDLVGALARRAAVLRSGRDPAEVEGRVVVVVDDGVATGATFRAGLELLRARDPAELIVAVPVAPPEAYDQLCRLAERVECVLLPDDFVAVGHWYDDFTQVTDEEVVAALTDVAEGRDDGRAADGDGGADRGVSSPRRATPGRAPGDSG